MNEKKRRYSRLMSRKPRKKMVTEEEVATDYKLEQFLKDVEKFSKDKRGLFENGLRSKATAKEILGKNEQARLEGNLDDLVLNRCEEDVKSDSPPELAKSLNKKDRVCVEKKITGIEDISDGEERKTEVRPNEGGRGSSEVKEKLGSEPSASQPLPSLFQFSPTVQKNEFFNFEKEFKNIYNDPKINFLDSIKKTRTKKNCKFVVSQSNNSEVLFDRQHSTKQQSNSYNEKSMDFFLSSNFSRPLVKEKSPAEGFESLWKEDNSRHFFPTTSRKKINGIYAKCLGNEKKTPGPKNHGCTVDRLRKKSVSTVGKWPDVCDMKLPTRSATNARKPPSHLPAAVGIPKIKFPKINKVIFSPHRL